MRAFFKSKKISQKEVAESERASKADKEAVLIKLWNFSVAQEAMEDELYERNNGYLDDDDY